MPSSASSDKAKRDFCRPRSGQSHTVPTHKPTCLFSQGQDKARLCPLKGQHVCSVNTGAEDTGTNGMRSKDVPSRVPGCPLPLTPGSTVCQLNSSAGRSGLVPRGRGKAEGQGHWSAGRARLEHRPPRASARKTHTHLPPWELRAAAAHLACRGGPSRDWEAPGANWLSQQPPEPADDQEAARGHVQGFSHSPSPSTERASRIIYC